MNPETYSYLAKYVVPLEGEGWGVTADLDPPYPLEDLDPPSSNPLADMDPPSQIWTPSPYPPAYLGPPGPNLLADMYPPWQIWTPAIGYGPPPPRVQIC